MIERRKYLDALIRRQWNGRIKVITIRDFSEKLFLGLGFP